MQPLWIKESDEKVNKWHEQQKSSPLGSTGPQEFVAFSYSTGHSRVCCIVLTSFLEQSLWILDFEAKKAILAKNLQKQTKDGLQLLPPLHSLDHNPKWNQGTMFHPYVLPVFSCSSYFWPSLSCMFFLMGNKSKWNLINLQLWWQELFHQLKSTPYTISLRSKTLLIWHIVVFMFGWWKCSHMNEIITIKVLRIPIPHSIHPMCPWSNLRVNNNISRESVLITGCGMHDWFHLHFWWNWFVCT